MLLLIHQRNSNNKRLHFNCSLFDYSLDLNGLSFISSNCNGGKNQHDHPSPTGTNASDKNVSGNRVTIGIPVVVMARILKKPAFVNTAFR
jgi:hypothetical protein